MKISLRLDVTIFDAKNIIKWLDNEDVKNILMKILIQLHR